jgi:hypothetical protein
VIAALGMALSVTTAGVGAGAAPATPASHVLGKDLDCQSGYFALTAELVSGGHYFSTPSEEGRLYTTFFSPDDSTVWRFTLAGHPAHPAVAVLNTGPKGISLKGACGYGDGPSFETFVEDFQITQARRGR